MLTAKTIKGYGYWESAIEALEEMMPGIMEKKLQHWLKNNFHST